MASRETRCSSACSGASVGFDANPSHLNGWPSVGSRRLAPALTQQVEPPITFRHPQPGTGDRWSRDRQCDS
eukprot:scaffold3013_cov316-Prasinococcus_capsulatus_cf.AAC.7